MNNRNKFCDVVLYIINQKKQLFNFSLIASSAILSNTTERTYTFNKLNKTKDGTCIIKIKRI